MAIIPAGSFLMGSPPGEAGYLPALFAISLIRTGLAANSS